jgi:hypothetical protein
LAAGSSPSDPASFPRWAVPGRPTAITQADRLDQVTVSLADDEPLRLFQAFITLVYLTRSLVETY